MNARAARERRARRRGRLGLALMTLGAMAVGAGLGVLLTTSGQELRWVVVAARDIAPGTWITTEHLTVRLNWVAAGERELVHVPELALGRLAERGVYAGERLGLADLTLARLPEAAPDPAIAPAPAAEPELGAPMPIELERRLSAIARELVEPGAVVVAVPVLVALAEDGRAIEERLERWPPGAPGEMERTDPLEAEIAELGRRLGHVGTSPSDLLPLEPNEGTAPGS